MMTSHSPPPAAGGNSPSSAPPAGTAPPAEATDQAPPPSPEESDPGDWAGVGVGATEPPPPSPDEWSSKSWPPPSPGTLEAGLASETPWPPPPPSDVSYVACYASCDALTDEYSIYACMTLWGNGGFEDLCGQNDPPVGFTNNSLIGEMCPDSCADLGYVDKGRDWLDAEDYCDGHGYGKIECTKRESCCVFDSGSCNSRIGPAQCQTAATYTGDGWCSDCTQTCAYLDDGSCDDGGPGAMYQDCPLGHDCADCGPRFLSDQHGGVAPPPSPSSFGRRRRSLGVGGAGSSGSEGGEVYMMPGDEDEGDEDDDNQYSDSDGDGGMDGGMMTSASYTGLLAVCAVDPPTPPTPPTPPAPPPMMCENTCEVASYDDPDAPPDTLYNGVCEDGRPDCGQEAMYLIGYADALDPDTGCPVFRWCDPGTDCGDCGGLELKPPPSAPPPLAPPFAPLPAAAGIGEAPGLHATISFTRSSSFAAGDNEAAEPALAAALHALLGCGAAPFCRVVVTRLNADHPPPPPPPNEPPARNALATSGSTTTSTTTASSSDEPASGEAGSGSGSGDDGAASDLPLAVYDVDVLWIHFDVSGLSDGAATSAVDRHADALPEGTAARDAALLTLQGVSLRRSRARRLSRARSLRELTQLTLTALLLANGMPASFGLVAVPTFTPIVEVVTFLMPPSPPPPPPTPPPSPPPPSPPSPPSPPPGLCTDTCNWLGGVVGECNDGGSGSIASKVACEYGTDCGDCGVRIYCVDCPAACQAAAIAEPASACMQDMWDDGACDERCNNLACGHNDCTAAQVIGKCVADQDLFGVGFSAAPDADSGHATYVDPTTGASLVPMNMQLDLAKARLEIDLSINEMVLTNEVKFVLQWQDHRLKASPCKQVLSEMLDLSREEAKSDIQRSLKTAYRVRYWVPRLDALALTPGFYAFVDEASFLLEDSGYWQEGLAPNTSAADYYAAAAGNDTDTSAVAVATGRRLAVDAHNRRRAAEHETLAERSARAVADGECAPPPAGSDHLDMVRKERHAARMLRPRGGPHGGGAPHWREAERRRLQETSSDVDDAGAPCEDCVSWTGEVEFQMLQSFKYTQFPFDRHTIHIEYIVKGADLYTCTGRDGLAIMGLTDGNAQSLLLPSTGTWHLDGPIDESVSLAHPRNALTGAPKRDRCVVQIKIKRNWLIFFVKQICTMLLVTAGGLMALLMQPGELLGDRCAQILVSVLITITTLQTDIGLGNLSYLIWTDWFNLMQLLVLLVALTQTMVIHRLDHLGGASADLLVFVDRVSRVAIPLLIYPSCVVGMIAHGLGHTALGNAVLFGGVGATLLVSLAWTRRGYIGAIEARKRAIKQVQRMPADADDGVKVKLMKHLFNKFDLDGGGEVDLKEMRHLLDELYPAAPRTAISKGMIEVQKFTGVDEDLDLASFIDAIEASKHAIEGHLVLDDNAIIAKAAHHHNNSMADASGAARTPKGTRDTRSLPETPALPPTAEAAPAAASGLAC